jgi:predicted alpha-1,2-mannosidase
MWKIVRWIIWPFGLALMLIVLFLGGVWIKYQVIVGGEPGDLQGAKKPAYPIIEKVNPFIGTGGFPPWVCAYNFPGASVPFGLVRLGPETASIVTHDRTHSTSGYYYGDNKILGFSHTRLVGTGATDGGHILVLPRMGEVGEEVFDDAPFSRFSHNKEQAFPGYYAVQLKKPDVLVELTATGRVGLHRYTFHGADIPRIRMDVSNALGGKRSEEGQVTLNPTTGELEGSIRTFGSFGSRFGGLKVYFVARVSAPVSSFGTWNESGFVIGRSTSSGNTVGVEMSFERYNQPQVVELRVALSHVSIENARENLETEVGNSEFDHVLLNAQRSWARKLSVIEIEGGTPQQETIFLSALYRSFQMPTVFTDVNGEYFGFDKAVHLAEDFDYYTDLSLWDTFRTLHPLYNLVARREQGHMMRSLEEMGRAGGYLPRWPSGNGYTNSMLGTPADVAITEAWLKGITNFDVEFTYDLMKKTALASTPEGSAFSGRRGNDDCIECGFCPADRMEQAVSRTLEYAWSDHSIGLLARSLGREEDAVFFEKKSKAYKEVWNPDTRYFHPRNADGTFVSEFKPLLLTYLDFDREYTDDYVEGSALQWRWMVPFDPEGLISLFGSKEVFADALNDFFEKSDPGMATFSPGSYYWHGNEPDIHAAYLFNAADRPDLAQKWTRWIMDNKYGTDYIGLDGNDDGATLSAWYILSALGFYPIAGTDIYQIGSPIFRKVKINMGDCLLEVVVDNHAPENIYVQQLWLNDKLLNRHWFKHSEIADGGQIRFEMGPIPPGF